MNRTGYLMLAVLLLILPSGRAQAKQEDAAKQAISQERLEAQRAEIDTMARKSLDRLFVENPESKAVSDRSYGHAVFDSTKIALGLSAGGGGGVAVSKSGREYMRMATVGVGLGVGAQNYQIVLFFENKAAFDHFVSGGWNTEASADAGAGDHGANASRTPESGVTIFKLSDTGLIANADLSGTRFWRVEKLNS